MTQPNDRNGGGDRTPARPKNVLLLSTSLLVDRVFRYTALVDALAENANVSIWASSFDGSNILDVHNWADAQATVSAFPSVRPFREIPYNYLRRLNEFVWDYRYLPPSRMSILKHIRNPKAPFRIKALKPPAWVLAQLGTERVIEAGIEKLL